MEAAGVVVDDADDEMQLYVWAGKSALRAQEGARLGVVRRQQAGAAIAPLEVVPGWRAARCRA